MKRRIRIIQSVILLFIALNFILVYFDRAEKVERKAYVNDWSEAFQSDMKEQLYTPGVIASTGKEYVYFDKSLGQFEQFLTEEGEDVSPGDPLYSYKVDNFSESEIKLSNDVEKLSGEVTAIESALSKMEQYQLPDPAGDDAKTVQITEDEILVELPEDTTEAGVIMEQYITEKEKELGQKQAELESAKSQLDALHSSGDTVIVDSPYDGRIKSIKTSLADPIVTIEQKELQVEGTFSEAERTEMEQGLPVEVMIKEKQALIEGEVDSISDVPETLKIAGESVYPFQVAFDDGSELDELLPGYHADVAITMKESPDATVLFEDVITNGAVWKMTTAGNIVKQPIKTGIYRDKRYEVTTGIDQGDWVANDDKSQYRSGETFITPIKLQDIPWKQLSQDKSKVKNIVTGILSR
jgi:HlyD family secretion protein